jgi:hypothetical protein
MYKQNLSVMGVASCRSAFLCLMSRVCLVPFRISVRDWISFSGRVCRGFRSTTWPSPARSGPRAPGAPCPPHARAPSLPLIHLSHLIFSRVVTSLSLFHLSLSPRGALGFGDVIAGVWIPGGEFSPSLLSLPPPSPFFFPWTRPSPILIEHVPWRVLPRRAPSPPRALRAGRRRAPPQRVAPRPRARCAPSLARHAPWRRLGRAASRA